MSHRSLRSTFVRTGAALVVLSITILLVGVLGKGYLDLKYLSSRVGSPMNWAAVYTAFEQQFVVGMTRDEVHDRLVELDPALQDRLPTEPECNVIEYELQCSEVIWAFERVGYKFNYVFVYTPDYRFVEMFISS